MLYADKIPTMNTDTTVPAMIVVMGVTGSGKSYFINQLAGRNVVEEGAGMRSCEYRAANVAMYGPRVTR